VKALVLVGLLALQPGCSWAFLEPAPRPIPRDRPPACESESNLPSVDLGAAAGLSMLTLVAILGASLGDRDPRLAWALAGSGGAVGLFGLSGVWGVHQVKRCRDAQLYTPAAVPGPEPGGG
jgi:hypothetical protein